LPKDETLGRPRTYRDIGALVDGERVAVVSGEREKSRVVPLLDVSHRGVKIPIDVVPVARKGGRTTILGPEREATARAGGGAPTTEAGEGRDARVGKVSSIGSIIFVRIFF